MAKIELTAAQIGLVDPLKSDVRSYEAAVAITKGQAVYLNTSGAAALATGIAVAAAAQFRGIALQAAAAGAMVDVLHDGLLYGYTVSSLNGDAVAYLSNTAGELSTTAATATVVAGRVVVLTDGPTKTKVLRIQTSWNRIWA